jgi:hypothetical protein
MNEAKFKLLARLLRSKEPVMNAAHLVLLRNLPNGEAAELTGVLPQSSSRCVASFRKLDAEIEKVYGMQKKSEC